MIRELKTFVAVAQAGSFAAAGERIGLTQAAVSAQMQRLEAHLGFALFERTGRSAHLNRQGSELLGQAQALLQQFARLGAPAQDDGRAVRLCIGAIASVQRAGLPAVLAGFHRAWPGSHSRLVPGLSMDLMDQVDAGELDAIVGLVAQGLGVALVPQTATRQRWPTGVRAVGLGPQTFHRDIGLLHRARRTLAEPVRDLIDRIRAAYPA